MNDAGKRAIRVNVKMSGEDYDLLHRAAATIWPQAIISNSGILLGLARIAATNALTRKKPATQV